MDLLVILLAGLLTAGLTFFSGFGLGTLLMPVFALFFPVEAAIAATAIVHFANNLFKLALVGRKADPSVTLRFALPAATMALVGASLLTRLGEWPAWARYPLLGSTFEIRPLMVVVAALIAGFAVLELSPQAQRWAFPARWIPLGGALSGFFGGLSGHQGALRSAFLIRVGLERDAYIGTVVVCAVWVDLVRLCVYGFSIQSEQLALLQDRHSLLLIATGCLSALAGSLLGARLLRKATFSSVQRWVGICLILFAVAMAAGWLNPVHS